MLTPDHADSTLNDASQNQSLQNKSKKLSAVQEQEAHYTVSSFQASRIVPSMPMI